MKKPLVLILIICTLVVVIFAIVRYQYAEKVAVKVDEEIITTTDPLCDSLTSNRPKGIEHEVACTLTIHEASGLTRRFEFTGNLIKVYESNNIDLVQTIELNKILSVGYGGPIFHIHDDINFDGYKDIWIRDGLGILDNTPSTYWVYNQTTGRFEPDPVLQSVSNPVFDPVKKEVTTSSRCCAGLSWNRGTYSFVNGKYILTYTFSHDYDYDDSNYAVEVETRLVNGRMEEVSRKRVVNTMRN